MSATATTESSNDTPRITRSEIPETPRYLACVKWFDNTLSYGFATILEGEHSGKDTFVHQSNIITDKEEIYRSLKKGEYVEFTIEPSENTTHQFQANYVTGIKKGPLMCETNSILANLRSSIFLVISLNLSFNDSKSSLAR